MPEKIRKVEGAEPDKDIDEEKAKKELEENQEEAQEFINSFRRFFDTFAKDISLKFKLGHAFFINFEKGEINLDFKWFKDRNFSKSQILWACLHELTHFRDLAEDTKGLLENFDYIFNEGKKIGQVLMEKAGTAAIEDQKKQRPVGSKKSGKTMNAFEAAAYEMHRIFYNIFDDIWVNSSVARRAPKYERNEQGGEEIEKLYREQLFKGTDYRNKPRHLQFLYKLLREEMVGEETQVGDEVASKFNQRIKFQGKFYTFKEVVDKFIKPGKERDTKASNRYFVLRETLEPIYKELLALDIKDWETKEKNKIQEKGEGGEGEGFPNPWSNDYKDFDDNNLDQIDPEDVEDWVNKNETDKKKEEEAKAKEEKEDKKTVSEKAKEVGEAMDRSWCEKHDINYKSMKSFKKIEGEIAPYLDDLSRLWTRIIFGSSKSILRKMKGHFPVGSELDIGRVIEEWGKLEKGEFEDARIMKKIVSRETLVKKPELIRIRLVGDLSGSMDEAKKHILKQCFVLILSSLKEFDTYLNLTRRDTKTKLEIDTEAWVFGSSFFKIKSLREEGGLENEQVEIIKVFGELDKGLGGTEDHGPLNEILSSIPASDFEKIASEKIMDIIFEITDGGSGTESETTQTIDKLVEKGVIARAFQIGKVNSQEKEIFERIWNKNRKEKLGEFIGPNIKNLIPAVTEALKKYLSNVQL